VSGGWQISVGQLSELARPAVYALSVLLSALVLAHARLLLRPSHAAVWTLGSLILPHVVIPIYVAARLLSPRTRADASTQKTATTTAPEEADSDVARRDAALTDEHGSDGGQAEEWQHEEGGDAGAGTDSTAAHDVSCPSLPARLSRLLLLPAVYAALLLAAGAVYFYFDYTSFEARLVRATDAALYGRRGRAIEELRAALAARDDAHTHKLLGFEFYAAGRFEEALASFRAAEERGEPDDALPFHTASALKALDRRAEAAVEYRRFLQTETCARATNDDDARCAAARKRLDAIDADEPPNGGGH
jgi:tetratricopeptide (TPR) repeat protein